MARDRPDSSPLLAILRAELTGQRTFLSGDEAAALVRPAATVDEEDLALDRVRHRRSVFYTALRDRYIRDGRPTEEWRELVASEEALAGGRTIISQLARQVLEWSSRTGDRGAMLGGFAAKLLRWMGILLVLLGLWGIYQGAPAGGAVVAITGALLALAGRIVGNIAAARAEELARRVFEPGAET